MGAFYFSSKKIYFQAPAKKFLRKGLTRKRNLAIITARQYKIAKITKEAMHIGMNDSGKGGIK